ncbi:hypothetical protein [Winogradskyella sp.]|uniref:hypothetical protein n=1 Tax=Winogradskyella sp. TaxID=1883156 RepID=UPI00261C3AB1|nr:hypothetical protein [Winogradskyella sp.]
MSTISATVTEEFKSKSKKAVNAIILFVISYLLLNFGYFKYKKELFNYKESLLNN